MPHRFAHRTRLNVDVELRHNGACIGSYRTRDIDSSAVFVEARDTGLNLHNVIEIDFLFDRGGRRRCKRKGVVIRCAADGLAVMLVDEDTLFFQALEELLSGTPAAQVASAMDETFNGQLRVTPFRSRYA